MGVLETLQQEDQLLKLRLEDARLKELLSQTAPEQPIDYSLPLPEESNPYEPEPYGPEPAIGFQEQLPEQPVINEPTTIQEPPAPELDFNSPEVPIDATRAPTTIQEPTTTIQESPALELYFNSPEVPIDATRSPTTIAEVQEPARLEAESRENNKGRIQKRNAFTGKDRLIPSDQENHDIGIEVDNSGLSAREYAEEVTGVKLPGQFPPKELYTEFTEFVGREAGQKLGGQTELETLGLQAKRYIDEIESKQKPQQEPTPAETPSADMEAAEPDISRVAEEPLSDKEVREVVGYKIGEGIKVLKEMPWSKLKNEITVGLGEDVPALLIAGGVLGTAKKLITAGKTVQEARKVVRMQKAFRAINQLPTEKKIAFLKVLDAKYPGSAIDVAELSNFYTTPKAARAAKAVLKVSKFPQEYPKLAEAANALSEVGVLLVPDIIKTNELPELEEIAAAGGMVGAFKVLKYVWGKKRIGKAISTEREVPKTKFKEEFSSQKGKYPATAKEIEKPSKQIEASQKPAPLKPKDASPQVEGGRPKTTQVSEKEITGTQDEEAAYEAYMAKEQYDMDLESWEAKLSQYGEEYRPMLTKMANYIKMNGQKKSGKGNMLIHEHIPRKSFGQASDELANAISLDLGTEVSESELMEMLGDIPIKPVNVIEEPAAKYPKKSKEQEYLDIMKKQEDMFSGEGDITKSQKALKSIAKQRSDKKKAADKGTEDLPLFDGVKGDDGQQALFEESAAYPENKKLDQLRKKTGVRKPAPTFYSKLKKVVDAKMPARMYAEQFTKMLKKNGVKDAEIQSMGLDDFPQGDEVITKKQIQSRIEKNQIELETVRKSQDDAKFEDYSKEGGEDYEEVLLTKKEKLTSLEDDAQRKYGKSWLDLTDNERGSLAMPKKDKYKSSHWDEKDVLAHGRVTFHKTPDGKKVYVSNEMQSDWAQEGKKKGFKKNDFTWDSELGKKAVRAIKGMDNLGFDSWRQAADAITKSSDWVNVFDIDHKYVETISNWQEAVQEQSKVPDMPFKKSFDKSGGGWGGLIFKQQLKDAVVSKADYFTWETGKAQADRYSLSKQVDEVLYKKMEDGTYAVSAMVPGYGHNLGEAIPETKLGDYVGQEVAKKIISGEGKLTEVQGKYGKMTSLSGVDLQVGGQGMKTFYDKMLPQAVSKYIKKWGAKVEDISIRTIDPQNPYKYKGPEYTPTELKKISKENKWEPEIHRLVTGLARHMDAFEAKMPESITDIYTKRNAEGLAELLGGKIVEIFKEETLPGFKITEDMADNVIFEGQALFEKKPNYSEGPPLPTGEARKNLNKFMKGSKVKDEDGNPLVVYHGTTQDFDVFKNKNLNIESHFGKGYYFTTSLKDVGTNYAGYGPDLTQKIELRAERLSYERDISIEEARKIADKGMTKHQGATMASYVNLKNPIILEPEGGTKIHLERDEEYYMDIAKDEIDKSDYVDDLDGYDDALNEKANEIYYYDYEPKEDGLAPKLRDAIIEVAPEYDVDGSEIWGKLDGELYFTDGSEYTAQEVFDKLRKIAEVVYIEHPETGELANNQFIRDVIEEMGHDGIIMDANAPGWNMSGIEPGTKHIIAFEANQIKSATGNIGKFDPTKENILEEKSPKYAKQLQLDFGDIPPVPLKKQPIKTQRANAKTNKLLLQMVANREDLSVSQIIKSMKSKGYTDLNGISVKNLDDFAAAVMIWRNPNFETFRIVYLKDDVVVGYNSYSSGLPGVTLVKPTTAKEALKFLPKIKWEMKKRGANGYGISHNHQSGVVNPSLADRKATAEFDSKLPGFKWHIITNHGTYTVIDKDLHAETRQFEAGKDVYARKGRKQITSAESMASYTSSLAIPENNIGLVFISGDLKVNGFTSIHKNVWKSAPKEFTNAVKNQTKVYGTRNIVAVAPNSTPKNVIYDLANSGMFMDVIQDGVSLVDLKGTLPTDVEWMNLKLNKLNEPTPKYGPGQKKLPAPETPSKALELLRKTKGFIKGAKSMTPPEALPIYDKWVREVQVRTFELSKFLNDLEHMGSEAEMEAVPFFVEGTGVPQKLEWKRDIQSVLDNPESRKRVKTMAAAWESHRDKMWRYMEDTRKDMPVQQIEAYVSHIWDLKDKKDLAKAVNFFTTRNPQLNKRIIPTLFEGIEKAGLKPKVLSIRDIAAVHGQNAIRTTENEVLLEGLMKLQDASGIKLIQRFDKAPPGWKSIDHPMLDRAMFIPGDEEAGKPGMLTKVPVKFHPDLAPLMNSVFSSPWNPTGKTALIVAAWEGANALLKQSQLGISFFHHIALAEAAIATMGPVKTLQIAFNAKAIKNALSHKDFAMFAEKYTIAQDGVEHGLMLGANPDVQKAEIDKIISVVGEYFETKGKGGKALSQVFKVMGWSKEKWDMALWDYYHNNLKLYAYETLVSREMKNITKKLSEKAIVTREDLDKVRKMKEEIASMVNDTFGGQNLLKQMSDPRFMRLFRAGFLSPDWLVSTLKQAGSIVTIGTVHAGNEGLRAKMGMKFWARATMWIGGFSMLVNYLTTKQDDARERGVSFREGKGVMMWDNDPGHETHLFQGRDAEGKKIYIRHGKQYREAPEFFYDSYAGQWSPVTATMKKLGGKMAPVPQLISSLATGKTVSGFPVKELQEVEGWDKTLAMAKVIGTAWLPFSFSAFRDERKKWSPMQFAFPTSKGMSIGKTRKLMKTALVNDDMEFLKKVWDAALENNIGKVDKIFNTAVSQLETDANDEFTSKLQYGGITEEELDAIDTPGELRIAGRQVKRLKQMKGSLDKLRQRKDLMDRKIEGYRKKTKLMRGELTDKQKASKEKLKRDMGF